MRKIIVSGFLQDANNYYIVRANALEGKFRLYHVIKGSRRQFAGADFEVTSGEWHELKVECIGNKVIAITMGKRRSKRRTTSSKKRARSACGPRQTQ